MKNFKSLALAIALFTTTFALAKITVYTDEQVLAYVLRSTELENLKSPGQPLNGMTLSKTNVKKKGNGGIGTVYDIQLSYHQGEASFTKCAVTARVVNMKDLSAPQGITANKLSLPQMSEVNCVY